MTIEPHIKEMALRRFWAGELAAPEQPAIEAHTAACARCRARLKEISDEQRRFEQEISYDRFAAGVERAARTPRRVAAPARALSLSGPTLRWFFPLASVAAAVALTFTFAPRLRPGDDTEPVPEHAANHTKGGSGITIQVAPAGHGPQRTAAVGAPEPLSPGERIRVGYQIGAHEYVLALSIDDQGEVTPLYPETGRSLRVSRVKGSIGSTHYLPDSVEFTGKGNERLIVILSDQALEVEAVKQAAHAAFQRAGNDLARLPALDLPGEQFQRSFVKP
jgi:hypothetical protein